MLLKLNVPQNVAPGVCRITWNQITTYHQMETVSALLALCAGNSPITSEFPSQRPVTRSFDAFFCVWINGWVNNREAGDLRRHLAHYDVTVMEYRLLCGRVKLLGLNFRIQLTRNYRDRVSIDAISLPQKWIHFIFWGLKILKTKYNNILRVLSNIFCTTNKHHQYSVLTHWSLGNLNEISDKKSSS